MDVLSSEIGSEIGEEIGYDENDDSGLRAV